MREIKLNFFREMQSLQSFQDWVREEKKSWDRIFANFFFRKFQRYRWNLKTRRNLRRKWKNIPEKLLWDFVLNWCSIWKNFFSPNFCQIAKIQTFKIIRKKKSLRSFYEVLGIIAKNLIYQKFPVYSIFFIFNFLPMTLLVYAIFLIFNFFR